MPDLTLSLTGPDTIGEVFFSWPRNAKNALTIVPPRRPPTKLLGYLAHEKHPLRGTLQ